MPNSQDSAPEVVIRTMDFGAMVRKAWGKEWNKPQVVYDFSNGREFKDSGDDHGIYTKD